MTVQMQPLHDKTRTFIHLCISIIAPIVLSPLNYYQIFISNVDLEKQKTKLRDALNH